MNFRNTLIATGLAVGVWQSQATAAPAQSPLFLIEGAESLVMLSLSVDHELFFKAYDDYSDIDGDGEVDTTYKHKIDYYGYFDSYKCYDYDAGMFVPQAKTADKYCDNVAGAWSGNFLNWATMTRIDAIRKVLYGGYRSTDTANSTILERTFLPTDAHSFVKYYDNSAGDVQKLTSYSATDISICNTTPDGGGQTNSKDVMTAPKMRIATGNYSMWTAHEGRQCAWYDEASASNANNYAVTGINASQTPPHDDAAGSAELTVRVDVCKASLLEGNCREYPNNNHKPIGLLQEHGEDGSVRFGLMTGSYDKNKSGGVLRKNVGDFRDEVNENSDGTLLAWPTATAPAAGGIVDTLNKLRLTRYSYGNRQYSDLDSCGFGKFGFTDGECSNWGNPQSELYLETLRYFAGLNATPAFAADDTAYINNLGTASWTDPLSNDNYCAPVSVIQFNASTSSFDGDQVGGFADLPSGGLGGLDAYTDAVGVGEGVTNAGEFFIGEVVGLDGDKSCSPKDLDNLSDARGICPEAPWLEGTYDIAGMAYYANQESIRDDLDDADGVTAEVKLKTYGVALSPAQPIINVPVPAGDGKQVTILPACMEFRSGSVNGAPTNANGRRHNGNCAIVDFRVVEPHTEKAGSPGVYEGKFMVLWESAQHGGDYDQDMGGVIRYEVDSTNITVFTDVYVESTGGIHGFGYVISGTTQDGLHIHSGINGFTHIEYEDPYGLLDCGNGCNVGNAETSQIYTIGTTTAVALQSPLYYAAKWGGFREEEEPLRRPPGADEPNNIPDQNYEWDSDGDGLPNNYFFARNPGQLSQQLAAVFETVAAVSSAASVVTNTVSLQTSTRIYQARFNSDFWSGGLLSFPVDMTTGALLPAEWDAGEVIAGQDPNARVWLTWNSELGEAGQGVAFRWDDNGTPEDQSDDDTPLSLGQRNALNTNPDTLLDDQLGPARLDYLRGDDSHELSTEGGTALQLPNGGELFFRSRPTPLGDVVHSSPTVVARPEFGYWDTLPGTNTVFESVPYSEFVTEFSESDCQDSDGDPITVWSAGTGGNAGGREPMVYFGANDGALHGVSACTGEESLAFVPSSVYSNLSRLTSTEYEHRYFVDGSPTVVDAFFDNEWRTVLLGTLAAGGSSVFALDVTDPNSFHEINAANVVLWEKNNSDADYADLGYTFSQPVIVKAQGHGWVAIFGNGYDSGAGKAVLYVARLSDGELLASIEVSAGPDNGLSTVSAIDRDSDGLVDLLYAGDLKGNVWRFAAPLNNKLLGFSAGTALYRAKSKDNVEQPITAAIEVGFHPFDATGRMVYFGTGKYYELEDQDPVNAVKYNTMYGIWDRDDGLTITSVTTRNSNILQQQTVYQLPPQTFGSYTSEVREVSNTELRWEIDETRPCNYSYPVGEERVCGWYLDLTNGGTSNEEENDTRGEKMVGFPQLRGARLIFVTTIPSLEPCKAGGDGWVMALNPATGGRLDYPVWDLNNDGVFTDLDNLSETVGEVTSYTPVSGRKSDVGILQPPAIVETGDGKERWYSSGSLSRGSGQDDDNLEQQDAQNKTLTVGRKSWARIR